MAFFRKFFRGSQEEQADANGQNRPPGAEETQMTTPEDSSELSVEQDAVPTDIAAENPDADQNQAPPTAADAPAGEWWVSLASPDSGQEPAAMPPTPSHTDAATSDVSESSTDTPLMPDESPALPSSETTPEGEDTNSEPASAEQTEDSTPHSRKAKTAPLRDSTRQLSPQSEPELTSRRSVQGLAVAALRDIGRVRKVNQDSIYALLSTLPRESADLPMGLFVVADGMGGHDSGEIASRIAIRTIARQIFAELVLPSLDDSMSEALQPLMITAVEEANGAIWSHAQNIGSDMGTTCTAVLLLGHSLYIAHVGDTRAYVLEDGQLHALTNDHSAVGRLIQLGQLDPSEAREHPLRNQLYRTIGQLPEVQVDFVYHALGNATHLLLCSDGLWGMVSEELMQQTLLHSTWPQDACHELIALANLAGGEDNISAIVVTLPIAERQP